VDGANLVLAARLEEDRTGSAWADAARLGTGISRAARLATGGDAARLATGETRLGYTKARGAASHAGAAHARVHAGAGRVSGGWRASVRVAGRVFGRTFAREASASGFRVARRLLVVRLPRLRSATATTGVSAALASDRSGAPRLADGLAADARRRLRLGFGVRETAAPTDARLRRSAWTILPARLGARRRLGCDCGSAALLNREGCLAARVRGGGGGGGVRRLGFQ